MSCAAPAACSPRSSRLRAHDDPSDDDCADAFFNPPDAAWVNDVDPLAELATEAGGVSLIDGDLERYRNDERRDA